VAVRALCFDVFGTLVDWRSGISRAFRVSELPGDPQDLAAEWRARLWPALAEINGGRRPWANLDEVHLATLGDLLSERGLDLASEAQRELVQVWHRLDPWPDVKDGLEELRRRHIVAALSNGHVALLVDLARHGDLRFDCLLSAELAGAYKPEAEVYRTGVRLLGLAPAQVMLVAAHPFDLEGARAVGLRTAFVARPLEHGPGSPARLDPGAEESVGDLQELAARLNDYAPEARTRMAEQPILIVQVASGGNVAVQLSAQPPPSIAGGDVVVEILAADSDGKLQPPPGGEVVLSVPSPEALRREAAEVRRVLERAGSGPDPLVVVVEAADELREDELSVVLGTARHSPRPVILRVIGNG